MYPRFHNLGKVCALVIAPLVLPFIAFAGKDNGKGNDGKTTATKRETILLRKLLKQTQPGCWFPSSARFYSFRGDGFLALKRNRVRRQEMLLCGFLRRLTSGAASESPPSFRLARLAM
jgi:hypothetical protein